MRHQATRCSTEIACGRKYSYGHACTHSLAELKLSTALMARDWDQSSPHGYLRFSLCPVHWRNTLVFSQTWNGVKMYKMAQIRVIKFFLHNKIETKNNGIRLPNSATRYGFWLFLYFLQKLLFSNKALKCKIHTGSLNPWIVRINCIMYGSVMLKYNFMSRYAYLKQKIYFARLDQFYWGMQLAAHFRRIYMVRCSLKTAV